MSESFMQSVSMRPLNSSMVTPLQRFAIMGLSAVIFTVPIVKPEFVNAQTVEPTFPLPNSQNSSPENPIDFRLTEQPKIKLDTIKVFVNDNQVSNNSLSFDTSNRSIRFQGTPASYNIGQNMLRVEFETQSGIQSQFEWPFSIGTTSTASTDSSTSETTVIETDTTTIPLKPEFTRQAISGNTLVLEGKTRPGSSVNVEITATRPSSSLFDLGPIVISSGQAQQRSMSGTTTATSEGNFKLEFNVAADPAGTQYQVEATATEGTETDTTNITLAR